LLDVTNRNRKQKEEGNAMPTEKTEPARAISPAISRMNVKIAELVKELVRDLDPLDLVEVLGGRAGSLLRADDNQNQNQNGSRSPRAQELQG
jgi:hypothetical protein